MKKNINLLKAFMLAIVSLSIGVIISIPHFYGHLKQGVDYSALQIHEDLQYARDETYAYAAEVNQYLNLSFNGDSYTWEHKKDPNLFVGEAASILPLVLLSVVMNSVPKAFALADFIFPIILFFIIFLLLRKNGYNFYFSIAAPAIVILMPFTSSLIPFIIKNGSSIFGPVGDPLFFTRTPHPQISDIYLFLAIFGTSQIIGKNNKNILLFALCVTFALYASIFISTTTALATFFVLMILKVNRRKKLFIAMIIILAALPLVYNYFKIQRDISSELSDRLTYPKDLLFPVQIRYFALALFAYFATGKNNISKTILIFITSALFISDFHQIVLSRSIDADHWISRVAAPLTTLTVLFPFYKFIKTKIIWLIVGFIMLTVGLYWQVDWTVKNKSILMPSVQQQQLTAAIQNNTKDGDVIGAYTRDINPFIPGLTGRKILYPPPDRALSSYDEQISRICKLKEVSDQYNLDSDVSELFKYEIYFQKWKTGKEDQNSLKCDAAKSTDYKLNYVVVKIGDTFSLIQVD